MDRTLKAVYIWILDSAGPSLDGIRAVTVRRNPAEDSR